MKKKVFLAVLMSSVLAANSISLYAADTSQTSSNTKQKTSIQTPGTEQINVDKGKKEEIKLADNQEMIIAKVASITSSTITFYQGIDKGNADSGKEGMTPPTKPEEETKQDQTTAMTGEEKNEVPPKPEGDNKAAISNEEVPMAKTDKASDMGQPEMNITWADTTTTLNLGTSVTINQRGGQDTSKALTYADIKAEDQVSLVVETDETTNTKAVISIEIMNDMGSKPDGQGTGSVSGDTGSIEGTAAYMVDGKTESQTGQNYNATTANQSAIKAVNGASVTITQSKITKTGDSTDTTESDFYGLNGAVLATKASNISLADTTITTDAEGANAVFATQEGSQITLKDVTIVTKANASRGLDATYGGTVTATNVDITTSGEHCAALATDRGEGTITLTGGTLNTAGDGSPCIYSTGNITANNVTGVSTGAQAAVIEGKNSITLNNSTLTGAGRAGVMLYQSFSGDAGVGTSVLNMTESKLTATAGPIFFVTNTDAIVNLENTTLVGSEGLIQASIDRWGEEGSNGGHLTLNAKEQKLEGDIVADDISTVAVNLTNSSALKSTINTGNSAQSMSLSLDATSTWEVTGDSYLTVFMNADTSLENIDDNGFTIYYDSTNTNNAWLNGKTVTLKDGGKLTPLQ